MDEDIEGQENLARGIKTPLALGEEWRTVFKYRLRFDRRWMSIIQPEMGRTGVTELMQIGHMAHAFYMDVIPHAAIGIGVFTATSLHGAGVGLFWLGSRIVVIPFYIMFVNVVLIDNRAALVIADISVDVPFVTWMMKGFFGGIPANRDAAVRIDGCSRLQASVDVVLPAAKPGIAAGLASFVGEHSVDWPGLMAAGTLSILPVFILFMLLESFLASGLSSGSIK